jgi:hypothetical protein
MQPLDQHPLPIALQKHISIVIISSYCLYTIYTKGTSARLQTPKARACQFQVRCCGEELSSPTTELMEALVSDDNNSALLIGEADAVSWKLWSPTAASS